MARRVYSGPPPIPQACGQCYGSVAEAGASLFRCFRVVPIAENLEETLQQFGEEDKRTRCRSLGGGRGCGGFRSRLGVRWEIVQ